MKKSFRFISAAAALIMAISGCSHNNEVPVGNTDNMGNTTISSSMPEQDTSVSFVTTERISSVPSDDADTADSTVVPTDNTVSASDVSELQQTKDTSSEASAVISGPQNSASDTTADKPAAQESPDTVLSVTEPQSGLSSASGQYEGRKGTGAFNYGEALQKSILFYDLQRSGDLPDDIRCNWRGDSCLNDGKDVGLDLSGGFFDAGDNVKFNLPMSYSTAVLAWSVIENRKEYEQSGQLEYILDNIRWGNDYFIKCHPEPNIYYYQVGDGNADHGWWGAAEVVETRMKRPSYKVDLNSGGSTVAAGTAASLASCAVVFSDTDKAYSQKCIKHAKELLSYAEKVSSDSGYTAANGFYQSWSGFSDEIAFASYWLYKATGDKQYLDKAKNYYSDGDVKWTFCWDSKNWGTALLLGKETGDRKYLNALERNLDFWCDDIRSTPKGLKYLDQWGTLRYSTTAAFLALSYIDSGKCPANKTDKYRKFAESQINYALGSTGMSYMIGFGDNYPQNPHHRTAHGSYTNNINDPATTRHILFGALVGGPDTNDRYDDSRSNYQNCEVACDYNAGFTGALAKMYAQYGGQMLKNFGAIEEKDDELYTDATINVNGQDFIEIKALVCNKTAFPARNTNNLRLCYFFDISEIKKAGGSASDLTVSTNYMQGGTASKVLCWNEAENLYYVAIDFSGVDIYPGGQDSYKKEVQFRIRNEKGIWDNSNDPSYIDIGAVPSGTLTKAKNMALYEGNKLVFGTEPNEKNTGDAIKDLKPVPPDNNGDQNNGTDSGNGSSGSGGGNVSAVSDKGTVTVTLDQQQAGGKGSTIQFSLRIKNTGNTGIDLKKLTADFLFTKDGKDMVFECDYADINGSAYKNVTGDVTGKFSSADGKNADTRCTISLKNGVLAGGETLTLNIRIHSSDWSEIDLGNDYSGGNADHITIKYNGKTI